MKRKYSTTIAYRRGNSCEQQLKSSVDKNTGKTTNIMVEKSGHKTIKLKKNRQSGCGAEKVNEANVGFQRGFDMDMDLEEGATVHNFNRMRFASRSLAYVAMARWNGGQIAPKHTLTHSQFHKLGTDVTINDIMYEDKIYDWIVQHIKYRFLCNALCAPHKMQCYQTFFFLFVTLFACFGFSCCCLLSAFCVTSCGYGFSSCTPFFSSPHILGHFVPYSVSLLNSCTLVFHCWCFFCARIRQEK